MFVFVKFINTLFLGLMTGCRISFSETGDYNLEKLSVLAECINKLFFEDGIGFEPSEFLFFINLEHNSEGSFFFGTISILSV